MENEQWMRIFCKANMNLNAAVRGDKVILVPADSSDKSQHWIQEYGDVGKLTDDQGRRAFALVNRTTGQAMVNINGEGEVKLAPYSGHVAVELSKLWSLGKKLADGFSDVRVLQATGFTLNGLNGRPKQGTVVGTYYAEETDNSLWKIVPINEE